MNGWGVEGCRGEQREYTLAQPRAKQKALGWAKVLAKAAKLVGRISVLDPAPGLLELACERAEEKAVK
jgi:hypothetical protein